MLRWILAAAISLTVSVHGFAADGADADIKPALYDIERAEKQAAGLTPKRAAKIKRVANMVEAAKARLGKSHNKTDASWTAASARVQALEQQIAQLTAPKAQAVNPAEGLTKYDLRQLGTVTRQTEGLIERVQKEDPLNFSQDSIASRWRGEAQRMKDLFMKISQPNHAYAASTAQKISALGFFIEQRITEAGNAAASLGDVKGHYEQVYQRSRINVPRPPEKPFGKEEILLFIQQIEVIRASAKEDHAWLQTIKGKTRDLAESEIDSMLSATGGREGRIQQAFEILTKESRVESWRGNPLGCPLSVSGVSPFVPG